MQQMGLISYGWNSVFAPRDTTRLLLADERLPSIAWKLVAMGIAATFVSSSVAELLQDAVDPQYTSEMPSLLFSGVAGRLMDALLYGALTLLTTLMIMGVWRFVFRFSVPPHGVLGATAMSCAMLLVVAPAQEVVLGVTSDLADFYLLLLFLAGFLFFVFFTAIYFAEALKLRYATAVGLNALAMGLVIFVLPLLLLLLVMPQSFALLFGRV